MNHDFPTIPLVKSRFDKPLSNLFKDHSSAIEKSCQYLAYGILISLYHFGKDFFNLYPVWAGITGLFSILTLVLLYIYSFYLFNKSEEIIEIRNEIESKKNEEEYQNNDKWIHTLYENMRKSSKKLLWSFQIGLFISVISFLFCAYFYFYGSLCEKHI